MLVSGMLLGNKNSLESAVADSKEYDLTFRL